MQTQTTDCTNCERIADEWLDGEKRVTCSSCGAVLTRGTVRARRWRLSDLEHLAKWEATFYGKGQSWNVNTTNVDKTEPRVEGELIHVKASRSTRLDFGGREDEHTAEWHRAARTHRRFEGMRAGAGCMHYAVLWYVIFTRDYSAQITVDGDAIADKKHNRLLFDLGWAFASSEQRVEWKKHKERALRAKLPRIYGQKLFDAAKQAWESTG